MECHWEVREVLRLPRETWCLCKFCASLWWPSRLQSLMQVSTNITVTKMKATYTIFPCPESNRFCWLVQQSLAVTGAIARPVEGAKDILYWELDRLVAVKGEWAGWFTIGRVKPKYNNYLFHGIEGASEGTQRSLMSPFSKLAKIFKVLNLGAKCFKNQCITWFIQNLRGRIWGGAGQLSAWWQLSSRVEPAVVRNVKDSWCNWSDVDMRKTECRLYLSKSRTKTRMGYKPVTV